MGRVAREKNQAMMIEAFDKVQEIYPDYELKIYGMDIEDGTKPKLEALIQEKELEKKVHFMGASSQLEKEVRDAAMFLLTSDFEGMPNALMEAMAMGLPCIATDCPCGGARALLEEREAGILVPVGDEKRLAEAMLFILENQKEAERMAERAMYIGEAASPENIYCQWKEYLEKISKGTGKS